MGAKAKHDIAPMIRGAFIRAAQRLEEKGRTLSEVILECLEENPLATLQAMAKFAPREATISGKIDHDHKHTHESVHDTAKWVEGVLGTGEGVEVKKLSSH